MTSNKSISLLVFVILLSLFSCQSGSKKELPILGFPTIQNGDTIPYQLPDYTYTRQDNTNFGTDNLENKPYIAYFFFTSCPMVCPRLTQGVLRVQRALKGNENDYNIIGFSIDPDRDTLEALSAYQEEYGIDKQNWHFLRGDEAAITQLGTKSFFIGISKDEGEPGGFLHSDKIILIDHDGHIRGYYSGTDSEDVKNLVADLKQLIKDTPQ
jgi:protein SCO1/2